MARVYRYVLAQRQSDLVQLAEEVEFARDYGSLLRIRFGEQLELCWHGADGECPGRIVPMSLQLLLENAVKHNEVSERHPLHVEIEIGDEAVRVRNRVRARTTAIPSVGIGLQNLASRVALATSRTLEIERNVETFAVTVPVVAHEDPCDT